GGAPAGFSFFSGCPGDVEGRRALDPFSVPGVIRAGLCAGLVWALALVVLSQVAQLRPAREAAPPLAAGAPPPPFPPPPPPPRARSSRASWPGAACPPTRRSTSRPLAAPPCAPPPTAPCAS